MPYVVTESCIRCKYMDCVSTCPVDCFHEGDNMLVINQDTCIDCAACEITCPVDAIMSDAVPLAESWIEINRQYASSWPVITQKGPVPGDADAWRDVKDKRRFLSALQNSTSQR